MAAPRVDRRLAAIMAVDVVGYSRLIGRRRGRYARPGQRPIGTSSPSP